VFYIAGFLVGIILWGFAIVWFIVAVIMIATSGGFPFNMGWWGFIFPVGQCFSSPWKIWLIVFLNRRIYPADDDDRRRA
jgi:Voltage-dependent anion channel